jgi:hypothetical protein
MLGQSALGWALDDLVAVMMHQPYDGRTDEEFVLGCLMSEPQTCRWELASLTPTLFRDPFQREVATVLCRLRDENQTVDRRRVVRQLGGSATSAGRLAQRLWNETGLTLGIATALLRLKRKTGR